MESIGKIITKWEATSQSPEGSIYMEYSKEIRIDKNIRVSVARRLNLHGIYLVTKIIMESVSQSPEGSIYMEL